MRGTFSIDNVSHVSFIYYRCIFYVYTHVRAWDFPAKVSLKGSHTREKFADELSAGDSPDTHNFPSTFPNPKAWGGFLPANGDRVFGREFLP